MSVMSGGETGTATGMCRARGSARCWAGTRQDVAGPGARASASLWAASQPLGQRAGHQPSGQLARQADRQLDRLGGYRPGHRVANWPAGQPSHQPGQPSPAQPLPPPPLSLLSLPQPSPGATGHHPPGSPAAIQLAGLRGYQTAGPLCPRVSVPCQSPSWGHSDNLGDSIQAPWGGRQRVTPSPGSASWASVGLLGCVRLCHLSWPSHSRGARWQLRGHNVPVPLAKRGPTMPGGETEARPGRSRPSPNPPP